MEINKELIIHVAKLARLELTNSEISEYEKDFREILKVFSKIQNKIKIDTKNAYKKCLLKDKTNIKFAGMLDELKNYNLSSELFYNDFEVYVFKTHPEIGKIKLMILDLGAKYASLSGSGSTVFGIFSNKKDALKAHQFFSPHFSTIITNPKI